MLLLDPVIKPRERPILFQGDMVRAQRAGTKTQTRRVVKVPHSSRGETDVPQPRGDFWSPVLLDGALQWRANLEPVSHWPRKPVPCPYGQPGDRLWVRETFFAFGRWETRFSAKKGRDEWHFVDLTLESGKQYHYEVDDPVLIVGAKGRGGATPMWWKRPAIFMPRAASRISLEVTGVRVERLWEISDADVRAEGCEGTKLSYAKLWESINGPGSWDANPWVWVVEFRRAA